MTSADCPSDADLAAFHRGELPDVALDHVADHLERCAACDARVREFDQQTDPMIDALRGPAPAFEKVKVLDPALFAATVRWGPRSPFAPPPAAELPGYDILEQLGQGGMGVVHKARHRRLKRLVALKRLRAGAGWDVERFRAEAEAIARLHHPNIVQIYEIGESEGQPYLALELVEGGSLDKHLGRRPLPARAAAALLITLARAVHYAHTQGVVHRDLKPANVLLSVPGGPAASSYASTTSLLASGLLSAPKIVDFGIAKRIDSETHHTTAGSVVGTPSYMAPEQAEGRSKEVGPATDVYALGAIFYECLAGRPPFDGESTFETLRQVVQDEPVPPSRLQPKLPRDLETIALRCLRKEPARRYATAEQLADDLQRFLERRPIRARPASAAERLWKAAQRRPREALLAAAVVASVLTGMTLVTAQWRQAVQARSEAHDRAAEEEKARTLAQRREARLAFEQGIRLGDHGEFDRALLWLARALERADAAGADDLDGPLRVNLAEAARRHSRVVRRLHYGDQIRSAAFSPDGRWVAAVGNDGLARIWDANSGAPHGQPLPQWTQLPLPPALARPMLSRGAVGVAFSPDGSRLLAGSGDSRARVWDWRRGALESTLSYSALDIGGEVWDVAYSPDGRSIVTGHGDGAVRVWDTATGRVRTTVTIANSLVPYSAAFADGGRVVLAAGRFGGLGAFDAATGKRLLDVTPAWVTVYRFAVSPDGRTVLTGGEHAAQLWDLEQRRPRGEPLPHTERVEAVAFSDDGRWLATGDNAGYIRVWDAATRQPVGPVWRHDDQVRAVRFSPDGRHLLVGGYDGVLRLWELPSPPTVEPALAFGRDVRAVGFSADGRWLLAAPEHGAAVFPARGQPNADTRFLRPSTRRPLLGAALSGDGQWVAASEWRASRVHLWDRATGSPSGVAELTATEPHTLAFAPGDRGLAALVLDRKPGANGLHWWDLAGGTPQRREWTVPVPNPECLAFQPGGRLLLTGSADGTARFWDWPDGRPDGSLGLADPVTAVAFRGDGAVAAVGCRDGSVRLYDVAARRPLRSAFGPGDKVEALAFSPDGTRLLIGCADRSARFWDTTSGLPLGPPLRHEGAVRCLAYHPDGTFVATAARDGVMQRWRVPAQPVDGSVEQVTRWVEVLTGMELDAHGSALPLSEEDLAGRRERLRALGGELPR